MDDFPSGRIAKKGRRVNLTSGTEEGGRMMASMTKDMSQSTKPRQDKLEKDSLWKRREGGQMIVQKTNGKALWKRKKWFWCDDAWWWKIKTRSPRNWRQRFMWCNVKVSASFMLNTREMMEKIDSKFLTGFVWLGHKTVLNYIFLQFFFHLTLQAETIAFY